MVIILIYEYAIAVELNSVQRKRHVHQDLEITNDQPHADKLNRQIFGFDQDYYERMPLLINDLQENNYVDYPFDITGPIVKKKRLNVTIVKSSLKSTLKPNPVRRTSPRPFYFEYRNPAPLPFSKAYNSRSWVERYRNEERLKNIRQIIKYLENTINAKVGDMHTNAMEKQIAFTGLYVEPMIENKSRDNDAKLDLQSASSDILRKIHINHLADPLFNFKPENPGDVNLLADNYFRFSPVSKPSISGISNQYPMFRQIPSQNRNCQGNKCQEYRNGNKHILHTSTDLIQTEIPPLSTTKSFSVMLNLYPITPKTDSTRPDTLTTTTSSHIDKIFLTTSRPLIQFKRKSNNALRRAYTPYKRPRYLSNLINKYSKTNKTKNININDTTRPDTQMIVHVKVYDEQVDVKNKTTNEIPVTDTPVTQTNPYTSKAPIEFSTSEIGDYHAGSSGYLSVSIKDDESLPKVSTVQSFIDTSTEYWNAPSSQSTEVVKFNVEDAKIPSQYIELSKNNNIGSIETYRRNSGEFIDREQLLQEMNPKVEKTLTSIDSLSKPKSDAESSTLAIKLENEVKENSSLGINETNTEETIVKDTMPISWTHVPQINGHYRSINQNSRNVNKWLGVDSENDRKKRLEMSVSGLRNYAPMYVEIKRNYTKNSHLDSDSSDDTT